MKPSLISTNIPTGVTYIFSKDLKYQQAEEPAFEKGEAWSSSTRPGQASTVEGKKALSGPSVSASRKVHGPITPFVTMP